MRFSRQEYSRVSGHSFLQGIFPTQGSRSSFLHCRWFLTIWATVSSQSCLCWLYRAFPSLAANNIINLILVSTIWWWPCDWFLANGIGAEWCIQNLGYIWNMNLMMSNQGPGKFSLGVQNKAGQRLTEFCQENALVITNTLFQPHKDTTLHMYITR